MFSSIDHSSELSKNTMKIIAALSVLLFSAAQATCPNGCSGHGTCGVDDIVSYVGMDVLSYCLYLHRFVILLLFCVY